MKTRSKVYARRPHQGADLHLRGYGNGLHELNNALGHEAGTRILTLIGKGFQQVFDEENPFRIDGDEFVSPVPHDNEENNQEKNRAHSADGRKRRGIMFSLAMRREIPRIQKSQ